ncbi:peroxisome biogenesis protein 3-2-like [Telopea speciosissima]|uniref:peroxisome biogenesis protein 3-2-like n=1 Tax=Telopea speciosissima TaxID=54955 RepID=UPI001CC3A991|nr:peroxisome biogenesis protein 3-2-like [Telopea speciosissima]
MLSLRDFWRRHRRKVFVTVGVLGSGYVLYKLYHAHKQKLSDLERELEGERATDELIKAQLQAHFENIQRIADSTTLPYSMNYLQSRISEELDLSHLTARLSQGKGQPNTLTSLEKLQLWERLKILSFTRMISSLWGMTMLSLYIRVQVNILGRHLYIDTAREGSHLLEQADPFDRHSHQEFLATADYLSSYGMITLISDMQTAAAEVLNGKQLRDLFNTNLLHETIVLILDIFMSLGGPNHWVTYLMPENAIAYKYQMATSSSTLLPDVTKLDQLMVETRSVLLCDDFRNVVTISLRTVVDALMDDIGLQSGGNPSIGIPLAKLLPRVAQMGPLLLEEPGSNRFIQIIRRLPEVELFYTLLYANMPPSETTQEADSSFNSTSPFSGQ